MRGMLAILAVFIWTSAQAAAPLPDAHGSVRLSPHVEVLEDPEGTLMLDDVRHAPLAWRFRPAGAGPINFGYTRSAWWLRFSLPSGRADAGDLLLELAFPSIDRIELH